MIQLQGSRRCRPRLFEDTDFPLPYAVTPIPAASPFQGTCAASRTKKRPASTFTSSDKAACRQRAFYRRHVHQHLDCSFRFFLHRVCFFVRPAPLTRISIYVHAIAIIWRMIHRRLIIALEIRDAAQQEVEITQTTRRVECLIQVGRDGPLNK